MEPTLLNLNPAHQVYERLWTDALSHFSQGQVELDPHLLNPEQDFRRGISLIIRPADHRNPAGVRRQRLVYVARQGADGGSLSVARRILSKILASSN